MESGYCQNCHHPVELMYCPACGQRTDTHRITVKHFLMHDVLHGVWHLEKGLLFTLREAIMRPGQAALDYIGGRRIKFYNVFYLALLLIAFNAVLSHFLNSFLPPAPKESYGAEVNHFLATYYKIIVVSILPFFLAANALLFFKRWKLNIAEHMIVAGMALLNILLLVTPLLLFTFLNKVFDSATIEIIQKVLLILIPIAPLWTYFNAFHSRYSFLGISWRTLLFLVTVLFEMLMLFAIIVDRLTHGTNLVNFTI